MKQQRQQGQTQKAQHGPSPVNTTVGCRQSQQQSLASPARGQVDMPAVVQLLPARRAHAEGNYHLRHWQISRTAAVCSGPLHHNMWQLQTQLHGGKCAHSDICFVFNEARCCCCAVFRRSGLRCTGRRCKTCTVEQHCLCPHHTPNSA